MDEAVRFMSMDDLSRRFRENWARIEVGRINEPLYVFVSGVHSTNFTAYFDSLAASYRYDQVRKTSMTTDVLHIYITFAILFCRSISQTTSCPPLASQELATYTPTPTLSTCVGR